MVIKSWWYRNRVFLSNSLSALTTVIAPLIFTHGAFHWRLIVVAIVIAGIGIYGNHKQGKIWTLGGSWAAGGIGILAQRAGDLDITHMFILIIVALIGLGLPPTKDSIYQKTPTIQKANAEAAVLKEQIKEQLRK